MENFDFCGWATKTDVQCSDGRTIRKGAFQHQDGVTVPLVWNHDHKDPLNVLGHALLEHRDNGMYAYCTFNDTPQGENAKSLVKHGDVTALSIYANKLRQNGGDVIHGMIRELSLVLAGANPGAYIETVMAHSEDSDEEAVIYTGELLQLAHAEEAEVPEETPAEEPKPEVKEDEELDPELEHADDGKGEAEMADKTVKDVFDTLNEEQKTVVYALIGAAVEEAKNEQGDANMKHNAFENEMEETTLSHADIETIFEDARSCGSLKKSVLSHAGEYGIDNIDYLFPDAKAVTKEPFIVDRDQEWVSVIMNGVNRTPFSRIKSLSADITADEARAKGYVKGNLKLEEVFGLLKRTTDPQTVYKKQKLDRDDILDITDFNVVAWLRTEMRAKLNEELARAILLGDGRNALSADKIKEDHIRPIAKDAALYTINKSVGVNATANDVIDECIRAKKGYKGSGNMVAFVTEDFLIDAKLLRDTHGYRMYKTAAEIADAMGASKIVTVPVMEGVKGTLGGDLQVVMLNLKDYNVGADKGGEINTFEDFDIDYNQEKYLMETRCSGALTVPYAAITIEKLATE